MTAGVTVRDAEPGDVAAICGFGARVVPGLYRPLLGEESARSQVDMWWTRERIGAAVSARETVVAESDGEIVGVGERGTWEGEHVIWKLYVDPELRGRGIGKDLVTGLIAQLPPGTPRIRVEHFEANGRAGRFYEREGFAYLHTREHPENPALNVVWRERDLAR